MAKILIDLSTFMDDWFKTYELIFLGMAWSSLTSLASLHTGLIKANAEEGY